MAAPRSSPTVRSSVPTPVSGTVLSTLKRPQSASDLLDQAFQILTRHVSVPTARSILDLAQRKGNTEGSPDPGRLIQSIEHGLRLFVTDPTQVRECCAALEALVDTVPKESAAVVVLIHAEDDIANARLAARRAAASAGFSPIGITRLMTAISEVARNIVLYAAPGQVEILPLPAPRGVEVVARDRGAGIANLDQILSGNYRSRLGMGLGLRGVKSLAEQFDVQTAPGRGTVVRFVMRAT
jgi:serine/threonine-protein kinase RsbT